MNFSSLLRIVPFAAAVTFSPGAFSAVVISQGAAITQLVGTGGVNNGTETPSRLVDGTMGKYYGANGVAPAPLPTFEIIPTALFTSTVITSVTIFTGSDVPGRDPTVFSLFGSTDGINFVDIALNVTIDLPVTGTDLGGSTNMGRNSNNTGTSVNAAGGNSATVPITNSAAYTSYRVRIDSTRTAGVGTQMAELQLIGTVVPEPSSALLTVVAGLGMLAFRRR